MENSYIYIYIYISMIKTIGNIILMSYNLLRLQPLQLEIVIYEISFLNTLNICLSISFLRVYGGRSVGRLYLRSWILSLSGNFSQFGYWKYCGENRLLLCIERGIG
jgi:hypothetical protein